LAGSQPAAIAAVIALLRNVLLRRQGSIGTGFDNPHALRYLAEQIIPTRSNSMTHVLTTTLRLCLTTLLGALLFAAPVQAQDYGPNITLEQARVVLAAAEAEAVRQNFNVAIAVVDTAGNLVAFIRRDNTQTASVLVAQDKAVTAAIYKRPSKALQDGLAGGGAGLRILGLRGATPVEGGLPLIIDGRIIGAVGTSGVTSEQDSMVSTAGAAALQ
jgi:glc operon protein GlcG